MQTANRSLGLCSEVALVLTVLLSCCLLLLCSAVFLGLSGSGVFSYLPGARNNNMHVFNLSRHRAEVPASYFFHSPHPYRPFWSSGRKCSGLLRALLPVVVLYTSAQRPCRRSSEGALGRLVGWLLTVLVNFKQIWPVQKHDITSLEIKPRSLIIIHATEQLDSTGSGRYLSYQKVV